MRPFTGCNLTQGQIALYDLEDAERVEQYKWHAKWNEDTNSYYTVNKSGEHAIYMARLIMGLAFGDKRQVDHRNHNTLDNRKSNLRITTSKQNNQNKRNIKGYTPHKRNGQWIARIKVGNKNVYLGLFSTEDEARLAYLAARIKYGYIESPDYDTSKKSSLLLKKEIKGYTWHKAKKKWCAQTSANYKHIFIGYFDTEEEARQAYLDFKDTQILK